MARHAILRVSAEMLVTMCKPSGCWQHTYEVVENALPEDAIWAGMAYDDGGQGHVIGLVVESAEFADIQPGDKVPFLPDPAFRMHYHEAMPPIVESIKIH